MYWFSVVSASTLTRPRYLLLTMCIEFKYLRPPSSPTNLDVAIVPSVRRENGHCRFG